MSLAVVGVSHRTAPLEVRERFVIGPEATAAALRELAGAGCDEAVLLSTCNRTELYLHAPSSGVDAPALGARLLADRSGMEEFEAGAYLYAFHGEDTVEHLFRVVTSLDSMILGEAQIQGQVREAYGRAVELDGGTYRVGPVLSRLFENALAVGARVRAETRLGTGAASIPAAAIQLARSVLGPLEGRSAVVLGAGEMAALALRCLQSEGARSKLVVSRTEDRAHAVADRYGGRAVAWEQLPALLGHVDVVVSATSAPHPVITHAIVETAVRGRADSPLVILDVALPRDVEPAVGELAGVHLFDIDDLSQVVAGTFEARLSEVALAERIIAHAAVDFCDWYRSRGVVPLIRALREHAESLRQRELRRARASLAHLSEEDFEAVERLTRQLLAKLLHEPTARLRHAAERGEHEDLARVARHLFSLDPGRDTE